MAAAANGCTTESLPENIQAILGGFITSFQGEPVQPQVDLLNSHFFKSGMSNLIYFINCYYDSIHDFRKGYRNKSEKYFTDEESDDTSIVNKSAINKAKANAEKKGRKLFVDKIVNRLFRMGILSFQRYQSPGVIYPPACTNANKLITFVTSCLSHGSNITLSDFEPRVVTTLEKYIGMPTSRKPISFQELANPHLVLPDVDELELTVSPGEKTLNQLILSGENQIIVYNLLRFLYGHDQRYSEQFNSLTFPFNQANKGHHVRILFDMADGKAGSIFKDCPIVGRVITPQVMADSAPTSDDQVGHGNKGLDTYYLAIGDTQDGTFNVDSNMFTKGQYEITCVGKKSLRNFGAGPLRYFFTYNYKHISSNKVSSVTFDHAAGEINGPSVDYLLQIENIMMNRDMTDPTQRQQAIELIRQIPISSCMRLADKFSDEMLDDILAHSNEYDLFFDTKREGDYGATKEAALLHRLMPTIFITGDQLCSLTSRLRGTPTILNGNKTIRVYRGKPSTDERIDIHYLLRLYCMKLIQVCDLLTTINNNIVAFNQYCNSMINQWIPAYFRTILESGDTYRFIDIIRFHRWFDILIYLETIQTYVANINVDENMYGQFVAFKQKYEQCNGDNNFLFQFSKYVIQPHHFTNPTPEIVQQLQYIQSQPMEYDSLHVYMNQLHEQFNTDESHIFTSGPFTAMYVNPVKSIEDMTSFFYKFEKELLRIQKIQGEETNQVTLSDNIDIPFLSYDNQPKKGIYTLLASELELLYRYVTDPKKIPSIGINYHQLINMKNETSPSSGDSDESSNSDEPASSKKEVSVSKSGYNTLLSHLYDTFYSKKILNQHIKLSQFHIDVPEQYNTFLKQNPNQEPFNTMRAKIQSLYETHYNTDSELFTAILAYAETKSTNQPNQPIVQGAIQPTPIITHTEEKEYMEKTSGLFSVESEWPADAVIAIPGGATQSGGRRPHHRKRQSGGQYESIYSMTRGELFSVLCNNAALFTQAVCSDDYLNHVYRKDSRPFPFEKMFQSDTVKVRMYSLLSEIQETWSHMCREHSATDDTTSLFFYYLFHLRIGDVSQLDDIYLCNKASRVLFMLTFLYDMMIGINYSYVFRLKELYRSYFPNTITLFEQTNTLYDDKWNILHNTLQLDMAFFDPSYFNMAPLLSKFINDPRKTRKVKKPSMLKAQRITTPYERISTKKIIKSGHEYEYEINPKLSQAVDKSKLHMFLDLPINRSYKSKFNMNIFDPNELNFKNGGGTRRKQKTTGSAQTKKKHGKKKASQKQRHIRVKPLRVKSR